MKKISCKGKKVFAFPYEERDRTGEPVVLYGTKVPICERSESSRSSENFTYGVYVLFVDLT